MNTETQKKINADELLAKFKIIAEKNEERLVWYWKLCFNDTSDYIPKSFDIELHSLRQKAAVYALRRNENPTVPLLDQVENIKKYLLDVMPEREKLYEELIAHRDEWNITRLIPIMEKMNQLVDVADQLRDEGVAEAVRRKEYLKKRKALIKSIA